MYQKVSRRSYSNPYPAVYVSKRDKTIRSTFAGERALIHCYLDETSCIDAIYLILIQIFPTHYSMWYGTFILFQLSIIRNAVAILRIVLFYIFVHTIRNSQFVLLSIIHDLSMGGARMNGTQNMEPYSRGRVLLRTIMASFVSFSRRCYLIVLFYKKKQF